MFTPEIILSLAIAAAAFTALNLAFELKRDMMMLQQNSYRIERYMRWLRESADTTGGWRIAALIIFLIGLTKFNLRDGSIVLIIVFSVLNIARLWRKKYKKPLVATKRVWRITSVSVLLCLAFTAGGVILFGLSPLTDSFYTVAETMLLLYLCSHMIVVSAVWLLKPVEKSINNKYIREASEILRSMPFLKVVGITGSYGKTSTKHFLNRILSEQYDTLMTPGSYNTTMGVVRTVRELLKPYNEIFIVEMGAKQPGDIKEICDIAHPGFGIVTAVGEQHLESFKSIENVQKTKFELVDALPASGVAVINNDFEKIADRPVENVEAIRYAVTNQEGADIVARDIKYSANGTEFIVEDLREGGMRPIALSTRLLGECNVSDLLAAVIMARCLGVPDSKIRYAVSRIEPVIHRLSITHASSGVTILDDAFNSNPVGSRMALDVLAQMGPGRRILVTPGMIELGDREEELNQAFGRHAADCADLVIVVGVYNRDAITAGLREGGIDFDRKVMVVDTFEEARQALSGILKSGDTVLYENDLPDTFK